MKCVKRMILLFDGNGWTIIHISMMGLVATVTWQDHNTSIIGLKRPMKKVYNLQYLDIFRNTF